MSGTAGVERSAKAAVAKGIGDILNGTATAESVLADVAVAAATTPIEQKPPSSRARRLAAGETPAPKPAPKAKSPKQRATSEPKAKAEKPAKIAKPKAARTLTMRVVVSMVLDVDAYIAEYGETTDDELRAAVEAAALSAMTTPGGLVANPDAVVRDAHIWRKARRVRKPKAVATS